MKSRVESGGHDVPEEKIISRYDRVLGLVKDVVRVCDVCHIYDNSGKRSLRIFKKRKDKHFYDKCSDWYFEDIQALTSVEDLERKNLN